MNVLALVGSDRKDGDTARIVQIIKARMRALESSRGVLLEFETLFPADKELNGALLTWGCHLVACAGFKMGAPATGEALPRFQPSAYRVGDRLFAAIESRRALRPSFVPIMAFRIQQLVRQREPAGS